MVSYSAQKVDKVALVKLAIEELVQGKKTGVLEIRLSQGGIVSVNLNTQII